MGRDFAIFRTLGKHHPIRTEQHDSRWLNGEKEEENQPKRHIYVWFKKGSVLLGPYF